MLFTAIIMENFSLFYSNDEDAIMSYNDIRNFQQAWNIIDVNRKVGWCFPIHLFHSQLHWVHLFLPICSGNGKSLLRSLPPSSHPS